MIITQTPLRISFSGGGTDLPRVCALIGSGEVVSSTVDKYVYVFVNRRRDSAIKISYSKIEFVNRVEDIQHNIIRESLKFFNITSGIDISYNADLPINTTGSGLGSSSALLVGIMLALSKYVEDNSFENPWKLAESAFALECSKINQSVGRQDHYSAAFGGLNHFTFYSDRTEVKPILMANDVLKNMFGNLFLFYTNITRDSEQILKLQNNNVDLDKNTYESMKKITELFSSSLRAGNIQSLPETLNAGWNLKKQIHSEISNSTINDLYTKAIMAGADGGKLCGAGGGGFLLFSIQPNNLDKVRKSIPGLDCEQVRYAEYGSRVVEIF